MAYQETAASNHKVYLQLTPRWFPLRYHKVQSLLYHEKKRFKIAKAGRRSGKTENFKRKLVMCQWELCPHNPHRRIVPWTDPRWFAGAPTREQAKAIFWDHLKALTPDAWVKRIYESDLCIRTNWGTELWVVGLDRPQRIEGRSWDGGGIDEFADCKPGMLQANIRPALADRAGWLWILGVPDASSANQIEYRDLVNAAEHDPKSEWGVYSWPSSDILPPEEVESARKLLDKRTFEQEYEGKFILDSGRAFPDFSRITHVDVPEFLPVYRPNYPLCWTMDFNVDPFVSLVGQYDKLSGVMWVIDEVEAHSTVTPAMVRMFLERARERQWSVNNLRVYGDPKGHDRNTASKKENTTNWTLVREELEMAGLTQQQFRFRVRKSHRSIQATRNAVNSKLRNANGDVKLYISSNCRRLIKELDSALWPSELKEEHATAALRYWIDREYPVKRAIFNGQVIETAAI